jgi:uncharacterized repeat protein (TIGR01451 family)
MNKQSSKSSRSATSVGAPAGRASFARLVSSLILALSALAGLFSPQRGGDGGVLPPLRTAQAAAGTWTQTEWTTPNATLGVVSSGTNQYFRPSSVSSYGQLVGTFGVCAGAGAWCQGPGDTAGGQTLRLWGNHKSDAANPYSSDLNGDGISELLFANHWNGSTYVFNGGWIYWGQGTPTSASWSTGQRTDLPTVGSVGAAVADLNGDGRPEVIFSNFYSGSTFNVNSYIYWGQAGGPYGVQYSAGARTDLPTSGAVGVPVADLNGDGRPEVIFANWYNVNSYIYWGQAGGPYGVTYSPSTRTDLPTSSAHSVAVADLNGDGRLEVIFANASGADSYVYWGQAGGPYGVTYSPSTRTNLPTSGAHGVSVADLNGDGRPEVIFANASGADSYVYWGQAGGPYGVQYSASQRTNLPGIGAHKASVADLNNDGQRDVVIQNYHGGFTRVFWGPLPGSGTATSYWDRSQAFGFRGLSLSDLNGDGRIDLLTGWQGTSSSYWTGGTSGRVYFHNANNSAPYDAAPSFDLPVQSSPGAYASFGPGRGSSADWFGQPRPVYGTAFPNFGVLESMVMDSGQAGTAWHTVSATTQISAGTGITLFVAASDNLSALSNPSWTQVGAMGNGSWTQSLSGVSGRYARYRVVLWRDRTTEASPALQQITFNYETVPTQSGFNKSAPTNGASGVSTSPTLSWTTSSDATHYEVCYDTTINGACNGTWQNVGNVLNTTLGGLAPGTQYEWQVRACNNAGCNGGADSGAWWTFTTASGPAGFSKASPAHNSSGHPTSLTLSWNSTSGQGTVSYEYCVNTTPSCSTWTNIGAATNVNVSGLSPGTTYYWQVRACDANGCTQANAGSFWSFQTAQTVGSFNKLVPGNGAVNVNTNTAQLQWAEASGSGVTYAVCVGTAVNNCDVLGGGPGQYASVGANQFRVLSDLPLQPNTTYYWQVLATNGVYTTFANGSSFAFWSFTTLPNGPGNFNKQTPAFNATNVPTSNITFQWTPANNAVSYTVCVGAFAGDCSYSVTGTATSAVLAGPLPAGATLVWQVTAHNAAGTNNADNNAWWPLTTVPNAPQAFTKFAPLNGATGQPVGVNLTWQDVPDETYYQVCVGLSPGVCTFVNVTTTANTINYALTGLDYATTYFWQVSACNAGGCTPANNGVAWSFSTVNPPVPGPFQKTTPANGALNVPTNTALVLLQWTASENADGYEVCLGTNPGTCDLSGGGFQDIGNFLGRYISQLPFSVTLQPASTYYWQVRAYNNVTATRTFADGGVDFHFTTLAASGPGSFSKDAPLNGAFNLPTATLALRWFPASGAASYEVCAGTAVNSCNAMPGNTWLNVGSAQAYTLTNLQVGTTYHWQVRAVNAGGTTAANGGAWWAFTTRSVPPPEAFTKAGPPHLATAVPTATAVLSWYVSTGASAYEVCIGSAPGLCEASGGWVNVGNTTQWTPPALNTATTYWWQVRALGSGLPVQADGGQWWAFTTLPEGPAAFGKRAPVQGANGQPFSGLTLQWFDSSGASGYQVCLGTQAGLCDVTGGWTGLVNGTAWTVNAALQPATTYWWQVRAVNAGGQTQADGGQWWYFTTAPTSGAPAAFGKRAPVNAAAGQPTAVTLRWDAAGGASGYRVCAGLLPGDCAASGGWVNVGNVTQWTLSGLNYATTYWWQVQALNASGQTMADGGAWWRFTTVNDPGMLLGPFRKQAPVHLATGVTAATAILSWTASASASSYEVCAGSGPGFCEVTGGWLNVGNVTQWAPAGLSAATTYWWQVRARDDAGGLLQADGGRWWAFTTAEDGPAAFAKQTPVQGASGQPFSGLQLSWATASGATGYQVCIGTQAGLCDVTGSWVSVGNVTNWPVGAALQPATTYWWQVRAVNSSGQMTQADGGRWWYFTTAAAGGAPAAFGKLLPANNASGQPLNPTLNWDAANDATGYQVCVGLLPGDCSASGGGWVDVGGTSHVLSGLSHATTYWWQVRAVNAGGQTLADGGVWWRFTTLNAPGSPIGAFGKSAPAHEAIGVATNATLSWDAAANAARYTVCVGTQPGLCDVMNNAEATGTSLALAGAQPGRTYWWQVTAHGASGALRLADEGAWWAFTTANDTAVGPGDFNKASPVSGTVVANPVVLVWGTSNGAIRYQVCLGRAIGLCDVLNNAIASSGTGWVLPAGSYWWQVTAVDAEGDTTQADGGIWWPLTVQRAADNVNTGGTTGTRKDVTPTVVRMGELVSYTIVVSNVGDAAVTVQVTDTLAVSATLVSATPGYNQTGQTLVWSGVSVPAGGTAVLTVTVRAASGPLPEGYLLFNSVIIGTADGEFTRSAPAVQVEPWRAFAPVVMRPPDLLPRVFMPIVMRP